MTPGYCARCHSAIQVSTLRAGHWSWIQGKQRIAIVREIGTISWCTTCGFRYVPVGG